MFCLFSCFFFCFFSSFYKPLLWTIRPCFVYMCVYQFIFMSSCLCFYDIFRIAQLFHLLACQFSQFTTFWKLSIFEFIVPSRVFWYDTRLCFFLQTVLCTCEQKGYDSKIQFWNHLAKGFRIPLEPKFEIKAHPNLYL